jgi:hypothetical protein
MAVLFIVLESAFVLWAGSNAWQNIPAIPAEPVAASEADEESKDPDLRRADALVKEATALLRDAAEGAELGRRPGNDAAALTSWLGRVVTKLKQARDVYSSRSGEKADPEIQRRLESITTLLEGLKVGADPAPSTNGEKK